jgi:raffinose/stachyose/melibiose transport system substrate-binding protein
MRKLLVIFLLVLACGFAWAAAQKEGKPTLQVVVSLPGVDEYIADFNNRFQKANPNIALTFENMGYNSYLDRMRTLAAAGNIPDLMFVQGIGQFKEMFKNGQIRDVSKDPLIAKFDEIGRQGLSVDGKVFGYPHDNVATGTYYNRKIFKDQGIDIPKDWNQFIAACRKLKSSGITPIAIGLKESVMSIFPTFAGYTSVVIGRNPDYEKQFLAGKAGFVGSDWKEVLEKFVQLEPFFPEGYMGLSIEQQHGMFANGQAAMDFIGNWMVSTFKSINPNLDFAVFPTPMNNPGEPLYALADVESGFAIGGKTKSYAEAKKWIDFFYQKDNYTQFLMIKKCYSSMPEIKLLFDDSQKYIVENYLSKELVRRYPWNMWPDGVYEMFGKGCQELLLKTKTIPELLKELDDYVAEKR